MAEMMQQYQGETPINRRSSMALADANVSGAAERTAGGSASASVSGGHRSLFHLSMPDIAANEKQLQIHHPSATSLHHKLATSSSGAGGPSRERGLKQPQQPPSQQSQPQQLHASGGGGWSLHNRKAQHRHDGSGGHSRNAVGGHHSSHSGGHLATTSNSSRRSGSSHGSSSRQEKTRETKARQNLNAKLEAVRKLSSESTSQSSSGGLSALSSQACDSGLGTPISLIDQVSSMTTSSQNSSHLSKWRSSMSEILERSHAWALTCFPFQCKQQGFPDGDSDSFTSYYG